MAHTNHHHSPHSPRASGHSVKETVSSLVVAFIFAFVFRGFVVEAFVIPTGSMAPTLLGKHMRFQSPESGTTWAVNPWDNDQGNNPLPIQGTKSTIAVTDPMTGARVGTELPGDMGIKIPTLSGDRIFVLKYLYSIYDPARFDVVVFKYPGPTNNPLTAGQQENYIKRLVGLPGEEVALVDGDVFTRNAEGTAGSLTRSDWAANNWKIARKPERIQRALWMTLYDSSAAPLNPEANLRTWFDSPWKGLTPDGSTDPNWTIDANTSYTLDSAAPTTLTWDNAARPINDSYPYNEVARGSRSTFAVADIRLAMGVEPEQDGLKLAAVLETRSHQFRAEIEGNRVLIRMRPLTEGTPGEWRTLEDTTTKRTLKAGKVTNVEFWHVDQSVQVWIEGKRVANAEYDWSPALRIEHTLGQPADDLLGPVAIGNPLASELLYPQPKVRWELEGSPVTLYRVRLARDLYYRPGVYRTPTGQPRLARDGEPSLGTHPAQPNILGPDQFFVCGDNSPNSLDGRLWDTPDPWVYTQIDPTIGVVPRDLLIGKAFFVYFPSFHKEKKLPMPDVGRMRFIW